MEGRVSTRAAGTCRVDSAAFVVTVNRGRPGHPWTEELSMAVYLIAFNDEWVPALTADDIRERGTAGRASSRR